METGTGINIESIEEGSEPFYVCSCNLCSKEGRSVKADQYCKECCQVLCTTCRTHHDKFLPNHQITETAEMKTPKQQFPASYSTVRCDVHQTEFVSMYCPNHNTVCCSICADLQHKQCVDLHDVQKAASGIKKSREIKQVQGAMRKILADIDKLKRARNYDNIRLGQEKQQIKTNIEQFRLRLNEKLDILEQITLDEVEDKYTEYEDKINADIAALEDMLSTLQRDLKQLELFKGDNESEFFVYMKNGEHSKTDAGKMLDRMAADAKMVTMAFNLKDNIEEYLEGLPSLGEFSEFPLKEGYICLKEDPYSANIKIKDDKSPCNITGLCQLNDGSILITDSLNNSLKRLTSNYAVSQYINLDGAPWGICTTGPEEVAVSLCESMRIEFFRTCTLTPIYEKDIDVDVVCRGVAYSKDVLYVSCGGVGDEPGHVRLYNTDTELIRSVQCDDSGRSIFSYPQHITVSRDGSRIYVADAYKGILTLTTEGHVVTTARDQKLTFPSGVCLDHAERVVVCGQRSNNILQLGLDGTTLRAVLNQSGGVSAPLAVCFDKQRYKFIVTMCNSNSIQVFDLM